MFENPLNCLLIYFNCSCIHISTPLPYFYGY